ncbi:MAG: hypothetical protein AB7V13_10740, partial [Pseudorhodoplanes sp.]
MRNVFGTLISSILVLGAATGFAAADTRSVQRPSDLERLIADTFNPRKAPAWRSDRKRKVVVVKKRNAVAAKKRGTVVVARSTPAPVAIDDGKLRDMVRESIVQNPGLFRPLVSEMIRTDPSIQKLLVQQVPPPAAAPSSQGTSQGPGFTPQQRSDIESIIRDYFIKNPEMIEELQTLAQAEKLKRVITENKQALFHSPTHV